MSRRDRQQWQTMLDADPALQAAWNGFTEQLAKDSALIGQGKQPNCRALAAAAHAVQVAAGTEQQGD